MTNHIFDYCVVGAGIVGLSVAYKLSQKYPYASILILEKEEGVGLHQTSHNSGVIHAGIYYAPGSIKSRLCKEGLIETKAFCEANDLPYENCGKIIVATNSTEEERVRQLYKRAKDNGANVTLIEKQQLREKEPNIEGTLAIFSPDTGIVDYLTIANKLAAIILDRAEMLTGEVVLDVKENANFVVISTANKTYQSKKIIACAGLQADRIAKLAGLDIDCKIVPFRGEYFKLPALKNDIIRHLIYPAPDPNLPFLGVHLTKMIDGCVTVGPNAVLGWAREGYKKYSIDLKDATNFACFSGFWKLIWNNRTHAISELKNSFLKREYLKECQKYCPSLNIDDLLPYRAGIRAQVVTKQGVAMHDFLVKKTERMLHVINAPSPAATSALPIARMIVDEYLV